MEGQDESRILVLLGRGEDTMLHRIMEIGEIFCLIAVLTGQVFASDLVALTDTWALVVSR
jgi:hypothetical protein